MAENVRILVELTFERLSMLACLDDTALLSHRVFPALKYFVRRGEVGWKKRNGHEHLKGKE